MQEQAEKNLEEVGQDYPELLLKSCKGGWATYAGPIAFTANHAGQGLVDDIFEIEISFPLVVSEDLPTAKEVGGRIPRKADFHINPNGTMCLGTPFELRQKFRQNPSLFAFINRQVIPFLYSFSFKEKNGYMPFGERSHGGEGIFEFYEEFFGTNSKLAVLEFLKIIIEDNYRGHLPCPCRSGKLLRKCHGSQIRDLKSRQTRQNFFYEFAQCWQTYTEEKKPLPHHFFTKRMRSCWYRLSASNDKNQQA